MHSPRFYPDRQVNLQYGFFYDSYDRKYYYWEFIILLEKLAMVLAITLLRRYNATLQVLASLIIIWVATVLQITFRPSRCMMLHTLQRASFYVLQLTLFLLMLSSLEDMARTRGVVLATLAIAAGFNAALVALFLYAFIMEARRLLLGMNFDAKNWWQAIVRKAVHTLCCSMQQGGPAAAAAPPGGAAPRQWAGQGQGVEMPKQAGKTAEWGTGASLKDSKPGPDQV